MQHDRMKSSTVAREPAPRLSPVDFHASLLRCRDVAACAALFKAAILPFGFDAYACGEVDTSDHELAVFYIVDWPEDWRQYYLASGLINRDPLIEALRFREKVFTWGDLRKDRRMLQAGGEALRRCAEHGWQDRLVIPIRRSDTRFELVSLVRRSPARDPQGADVLALAGESLMCRIRAVGQLEFPVPPAGLTGRQIDALRLVALGCSDARIAERLGISTTTAHQHVEGARLRLRAATRAHDAVAKAIGLGIVAVE